MLPKASETPRNERDFELVTWLVIPSVRTLGRDNQALNNTRGERDEW